MQSSSPSQEAVYKQNYACLLEHYPSLAARLDALPRKERIHIGRAQDGGL